MQKCDFNCIKITLPHGYFLANMLSICSRTSFFSILVWRTAFVYRSKYRGCKCRGPLKGKKLFEIHFNIINTFSNFMCDFRLEGRIPYGIRILWFLSESDSTVLITFSFFATRASFALVLHRVMLVLSRLASSFTHVVSCCVVLYSCCLVLYLCCVVLSRVVTRVVF